MERLATFFAGERYIAESRYRGLKVKEIAVGDDEDSGEVQRIVYTIDGDLLILTGGEELFHEAADRHLDGGRGGLVRDGRFVSAREKAGDLGRDGKKPCIFGYVDPGAMGEMPDASKTLSGIEGRLSWDLLVFSARIDGTAGDDPNPGEIVIGLEARGGEGRGPGGSRGGLSAGGLHESMIADDELMLVKVHDLSLFTEFALKDRPESMGAFVPVLSDLFFDGFTAAVVRGEEGCPGLVAWGKSPPGAMKIVNEVAGKNGWAVVEGETDGLETYSVVEAKDGGLELMVFALHDDMIFFGSGAELIAPLVDRVGERGSMGLSLKGAVLSRLGDGEGGITLTARPGPIRESIRACPSGFDPLSVRLDRPPEESTPFFTRLGFIGGLYPVGEVRAGLFNVDNGVAAEIRLKIDSDLEGGEAR
jgi:hypothetical protein